MTPSGPIRVKSGETLHDVWAVGDGGPAFLPDPGATGWTVDRFHLESPAPAVGDPREAYRAVSIYIQGGSGTIRNGHVRDTAAAVYAEGMEGRLVVESVHMSGIRWDRPRAVGIQMNGCTGGCIIDTLVSDASLQPGGIEDHVSIFNSRATQQNPHEVRNSWFRGGMGSGREPGKEPTGCGINFGDGGGAWARIHHNVLVEIANAAMGVGGTDATINDNLIWACGAPSTQSRSALVLYDAADRVQIMRNRALVLNHIGDGAGRLAAGFWAAPGVLGYTQEGNDWQDDSLTAAIWTPPEIYRMTTTDEEAIAKREAMLAAWRTGVFFEDILAQTTNLASALTGIAGAQLIAAQSVAKDAEQMRQAAERAPAAAKASDIARDAVALFADRYTVSTKGDPAIKGMAECVELARVARRLAEAP